MDGMPNRWGTREDRYTPADKRAILARDGYRCQLGYRGCLGVANVVDHIIPISKLPPGRGRDLSLGQAVCAPCHHIKTVRETGAAVRESNLRRSDRRKLPQYRRGAGHPGDP